MIGEPLHWHLFDLGLLPSTAQSSSHIPPMSHVEGILKMLRGAYHHGNPTKSTTFQLQEIPTRIPILDLLLQFLLLLKLTFDFHELLGPISKFRTAMGFRRHFCFSPQTHPFHDWCRTGVSKLTLSSTAPRQTVSGCVWAKYWAIRGGKQRNVFPSMNK